MKYITQNTSISFLMASSHPTKPTSSSTPFSHNSTWILLSHNGTWILPTWERRQSDTLVSLGYMLIITNWR